MKTGKMLLGLAAVFAISGLSGCHHYPYGRPHHPGPRLVIPVPPHPPEIVVPLPGIGPHHPRHRPCRHPGPHCWR